MTNKFELYKCNICGNLIEILLSGDGHPVCCGAEMERVEVKNDNLNSANLTEKHSPVIEKINEETSLITVKNHPMEESHYIMFVQAFSEDKNESYIKYFYPNEDVSMTSKIKDLKKARSYCNIHGLYVNEQE